MNNLQINPDTRKKIFGWSWFALIFIYLFFRYQNFPGVFSSAGIAVIDTDPYYRLYRIVSIVQGPWSYPLFDQHLEFPSGWDVAWPLGLDYIIATPLKLLHVSDPTSIMIFSFLVIPIITLPILFLTADAATLLSGSCWIGLLSAVFLTPMRTLLYETGVGRLDHHSFECLFMILHFWFLIRLRLRPSKWIAVFFTLSLGLANSIFPHGWVSCIGICLALVIEKDGLSLTRFSKILLIAFLISLIPLSLSSRFASGYVSIAGFSWWGSCCLLLSSTFVCVLAQIRKRNRDIKWFCAIGSIGILTFIFLLYKNGSAFLLREIHGGSSWLMAHQGVIHDTKESWSPFQFSVKALHDIVLIFSMPIVYLWFLSRKKYRDLLLYALFPIALTWFQIRFMTAASSFIAILLVLAIVDFTQTLSISRRQKIMVSCSFLFLLSLIYAPKMGFTHFRTHDPYLFPVEAGSKFLREEVRSHTYNQMSSGVIASWDFGHWILFYSGLPVVSDPFQGPHAYEVENLFTSKGMEGLGEFEKNIPARYLMIEHSIARYFQSLRSVGKDPAQYFTSIPQNDDSFAITPKPEFDHIFSQRFLFHLGSDDNGQGPEQWRLIYISPYDAQFSNNIPALKIFEHVSGVTIRLRSSEKLLYITAKIQEKTIENIYSQKSQFEQGVHRWKVPYAVYSRGDVGFGGIYQIKNSKGKWIAQTPVIQEKQVLQGDTINIP